MTISAYTIDDIDSILMQLHRLRAMFSAIIYILNPARSSKDCESEDMEIWLYDVQDRIDNVIKQIAK